MRTKSQNAKQSIILKSQHAHTYTHTHTHRYLRMKLMDLKNGTLYITVTYIHRHKVTESYQIHFTNQVDPCIWLSWLMEPEEVVIQCMLCDSNEKLVTVWSI